MKLSDRLRDAACTAIERGGEALLVQYRSSISQGTSAEERIGLLEAAFAAHVAAFNGLIEEIGVVLDVLPSVVWEPKKGDA